MQRLSYRKRALCALFLFLFSCTSSPQWHLEQVASCDPCFRSDRLVFEDTDPFCQLELELDSTLSGLRMYLNSFSRPLVAPCGSDFRIVVQVENQVHHFAAQLLQGGQRLLLSDEARDYVIEALLAGNFVAITAGSYRATIAPTRFATLYFQII